MEETTSERKARVAELAKAIKAKKAALDKQFNTVNTEVKRSLTVQETAIKRTRTVLEEVHRQEVEESSVTKQVDEVRGKSGVIRRRAKPGAENAAPAPVRRAEPVAASREERVEDGEGIEARESVSEREEVAPVREKAPARVEAEADEVREAVAPNALIRRAGRDVTPVAARTVPKPKAAPAPVEEEEVVAAAPEAVEREEAPVAEAVEAVEVGEPETPAAPMAAAPSTASGVPPIALIKRAGKDVTPAGLTFTPNQPRPIPGPRREVTVDNTGINTRGAPIPGTEKRTGKQVFELKEMTFGPGQFQGGRRKRVIPKKSQQKTQITTPKAIKRKIAIEGQITVGALAQRMAVKVGDLMKKLMSMGMMATMNQSIDVDTATLVAAEFGYEVSDVAFDETEVLGHEETAAETAEKELRAPVVTIMGHVDHGKTSLLDAIRKANVAGGEAGGITQHIGAYTVKDGDRSITFLDTPGHEAFTSMRARGAKLTDIVILVCAVDDGPQPQTIEAINHAKAAGVPIIVALNKVDKPGTDPEKIMQRLGSEHGLAPEEWGGETMYVRTSAKTGLGLKELLEAILLRADVMELKANPRKPAVGIIIEAKIDKGRGPVASVLIQEGTLKIGDAIVSGSHYGKVRAMVDDKGKALKEAGPSTPVEVLGLSGVPEAGDSLHVAADEKSAKDVAEHRTAKARETALGGPARKMPTENIFGSQSSAKELNVIVKADVQGSVEALGNALEKLSTDKVKVKVVAGSVGAVSESDVLLATASKAMIVAFNVKPDNRGREMADREHIGVKTYSIIYEALDDVRGMMVGLLEPIFRETALGKAEVRNVFTSSKVGAVAGCMVTEGKIKRNAKARVLRAGKVVFDGKIASLKRFKDDAGEVVEGFECGLSLDGYNDVQVGDEIACYGVEQFAATL